MNEEIMETEEQEYEEYEEQEEESIYPKFTVDSDGNPIRDARFYPFVSHVISSVNKTIASEYKYQHFE